MNPTISQLNDPAWWDLNAPKDATHWCENGRLPGFWYREGQDPNALRPNPAWLHKRPDHIAEINDMVNHPQHYQSDNGIECIDAIRAALGRDGFVAYCRGAAIKYAWRSGKKSEHAEDLRKAAWYLERAAEELDTE